MSRSYDPSTVHMIIQLVTRLEQILRLKNFLPVPDVVEHYAAGVSGNHVSALTMAIEDPKDLELSVINDEEIILILGVLQ